MLEKCKKCFEATKKKTVYYLVFYAWLKCKITLHFLYWGRPNPHYKQDRVPVLKQYPKV